MIVRLVKKYGFSSASLRPGLMAGFIIVSALNAETQTPDTSLEAEAKRFAAEYAKCTGDTAKRTLEELIAWRKDLHDTTETVRYKSMLVEYIAHTGHYRGFSPCDVLEWHSRREDSLAVYEDSLSARLLASADTTVDSLRAAKEFNKLASSPFDFPGLRFGLSPHVTRFIFQSAYKRTLKQGNYVLGKNVWYIDSFVIDGRFFHVFFSFDSGGLNKYWIQGDAFLSDSLNSIVRPQAKHLMHALERKFGKADRYNRIGYFDIKPERVTAYAQWDADRHKAIVGLTMIRYRYMAKAIVRRDAVP